MLHQCFRTAVLAAAAFLASAAPTSAGFIDFFAGTTIPGGTLTIGSTGVVGTGIQVTSAQGQGTNAHDGLSAVITNGLLNFSTGALLSTDSKGNQFYANGGSVTITGTTQGFTGTLLSGTFSGTNAVELQNLGSGTFRLLGGQITGAVAPALASYFNFDTTASNVGGFSLLLGGTGATPRVNSGNVAMTTGGTFSTAAVPEPSTVVMAGASGLFGLAYAWRRKRAA